MARVDLAIESNRLAVLPLLSLPINLQPNLVPASSNHV